MKRFVVPLIVCAAVCGCGGGGSSTSPAPPTGGSTPSGAPSATVSASPAASHAPGTSPSPGTSASPGVSASPHVSPSPSPSPAPPGAVVDVSGNDSVTYGGPLVLVATDSVTYTPGAPDTYGLATLLNNGTPVSSPAPTWVAGGAATTSVTPSNGATAGAGQTFVGTSATSAATGTISAGASPGPVSVYVYNRFSIVCFNGGGNGGQTEFLAGGVDFAANGTLTADATATADISVASACPASNPQTVTFGGSGALIYNGSTTLPAFTQLTSAAWTQAQSAGNLTTSLPLTTLEHTDTANGYQAVPIVIKAQSGVFVKLLITSVAPTIASEPAGTYTAVSGAYEVSNGPPENTSF